MSCITQSRENHLMIKIKDDVYEKMRAKGFNTMTAKKTGWISQMSLRAIREGRADLTLKTLNRICILLRCKPQDVLEFTITEQDKKDLAEMIVKSL